MGVNFIDRSHDIGVEDLKSSTLAFVEATKAIYTFCGTVSAAIIAGYVGKLEIITSGPCVRYSLILFIFSAFSATSAQYLFYLSKRNFFYYHNKGGDNRAKKGIIFRRSHWVLAVISLVSAFFATVMMTFSIVYSQ